MILRNTTKVDELDAAGSSVEGDFSSSTQIQLTTPQSNLYYMKLKDSNPQKPNALFVFKKNELKVYHMSMDTWKEGGIDATCESFLTLTVEDNAKTTADSIDMKTQHLHWRLLMQ